MESSETKLSPSDIDKALREFINASNVDQFSFKSARRELEKTLELNEGDLDSQKNTIKDCLNRLVAELEEKGASEQKETDKEAEDEDEDEDEDDQSSEPNSAKKPKLSNDQDEEEPPKDISRQQAKLMTQRQFEKRAKKELCQLGCSKVYLEPRVFSANAKGLSNVGWGYYKKVKMPIGDKQVWCSVSMNVIVAGSREWKR